MTERRGYRLAPLDTSGVFLGLSAGQCACLGGGLGLAVLAMSTGVPVAAAAIPPLLGGVLSFVRAGGLVLWEWLPVAVRWGWASTRGRRRWVAPLPLWPTDADRAPPLPPCLAGLEIVELPWRGDTGGLGAVRDREGRTATVLVPVAGDRFTAEDGDEQERLVGGWGTVLSQFATEQSAVSQVSWSELARPTGVEDHLSWLAASSGVATSPEPAAAGYRELLDTAAPATTTHDLVVGVTVAEDRLGRHDTAGGESGDPLEQALASVTGALQRGVDAAGLRPADPLDATGVRRLLRTRVDPTGSGPGRPAAARLGERLGLVPAPCASGPLAVDASWRHVRVDGAVHRTWWVACWPRLAVPASWLEPFLSADGVARVMTVVHLPVSVRQSRRRIERDLVKLESDAATKEDRGRRVDARHGRATDALLEREQELVSGYAEVAYVGLVSVAAPTVEQLEGHAEIVEQRALEVGMELRVLDGRQDSGWAATLPFGLAPRSLLAA